jgi:hypothetical protein
MRRMRVTASSALRERVSGSERVSVQVVPSVEAKLTLPGSDCQKTVGW